MEKAARHSFRNYIALGDSISIDLYPALDLGSKKPGHTDEVGAASLLHSNVDSLWPEFRGRDLRHLVTSCTFENLTADGATTDYLQDSLRRVKSGAERTLFSITIGGNDLLTRIGASVPGDFPGSITQGLAKCLQQLLERRRDCLILLSTVYDPSDGTNRLPLGGQVVQLDEPAGWLRRFNESVRTLARTDPRLRLADIHAHFLGHGLTVPVKDRWYWETSIIEPNARGASEVRRVWLEALGL